MRFRSHSVCGNSCKLPDEICDLDSVEPAVPANSGERDWWISLFTDSIAANYHTIYLEADEHHWRLRRRGPASLDEELLSDKATVNDNLNWLAACCQVEAAANSEQRHYLGFGYQNHTALASIEHTATSNGRSCHVQLFPSPGTQSTLDEMQLSASKLKRLRWLIHQSSGWLLVASTDTATRASMVRAIARDLTSPDKKLVCAELPVHPLLPRVDQLVYDGTPSAVDNWRRHCTMQMESVLLATELQSEDYRLLREPGCSARQVVAACNDDTATATLTRQLAHGANGQWLALSLNAIVVIKAVRLLCEHCQYGHDCSEEESRWIASMQPDITEDFTAWLQVNAEPAYRSSRGCPACLETGHRGVQNIVSIVEPSEFARDALRRNHLSAALDSLSDDLRLSRELLSMAAAGRISVAEAMRVAPSQRQLY